MRQFLLALSVSVVILIAGALVPESGGVKSLNPPASEIALPWNSVA